MVASSILEPGGFLGDELFSWCLRQSFINRLPASSATFICLESSEAFGLDADNLRFITINSEEYYDPAHFYGRVEAYPIADNHVPSLEMIKPFSESVDSWLASDPKNIAVIHCMVSIPSQRRYVTYWESILSNSVPRGTGNGPRDEKLPQPCSRELRRIWLYDTVYIDSIFFVMSELHEVSSSKFMSTMFGMLNYLSGIGYGGHIIFSFSVSLLISLAEVITIFASLHMVILLLVQHQ
ncbi:hypothetical protein Fmac_031482 [Flemingia macrophylla]|uniref:Uncharacterized protein n=1 Tax=Flemingia macrophylla TaxID=520843 RepID=A0ABD1L283_9FABA